MTKQADIIGDKNYIPVLDKGFVGVVETMGTDSSIVQAARVSYGKGTKSVNQDRGLIRYLIKHFHTSPVEMCVVKFHLRMPIFVARQWIRHRTASLNEESARYSEMTDEFYMPDYDVIQPQSTDNKQGRFGNISEKNKSGVQWILETVYNHALGGYKILLGNKDKELVEDWYDVYNQKNGILEEDFEGVARELARVAMPVSAYTEMYWKMDLHNLLHFLRLRQDSHAQYEIRVFADAIYELLLERFPLTMESYNDYIRNSYTLSRMDMLLIKDFVSSGKEYNTWYSDQVAVFKNEKELAKHYGMSERELVELKQKVLK
jgi:thymidylate synthase (FAD)